ncbi:unnamed protein product [Victoria cruziana]
MPSVSAFSHQHSLCHANDNVEASLDNGNVRWSQGRNNALWRRQEIAKQRRSLPIASVEQRIVEEVKKNDTLIVVGETGSGKTTQLPQFLFNGGFCRHGKVVGITQPRRVAAVTVATRVAEECGVELGKKVGYSIRFEDITSSATRIKYMTDGMLLREALLDPLLSKYSVIIIDEAHERTVHTDVLLGILKGVQKSRTQQVVYKDNVKHIGGIDSNEGTSTERGNGMKDQLTPSGHPLKLIVMSASLDARGFSEYLGGAKAVHVQGRKYPVEILYTYTPQQDYIDAALITIFQIHLEEDSGDILVFLTGQEEIESVERLVLDRCQHLPEGGQKLFTVPIYSALPSEQQMQAFKPAPFGFRKVILATNIAETSVTIPGIKYVIDTGLVKARSYHPQTGMESLSILPISKAQALQRSGRAGRDGPGKCFRLYTENEFDKLKDSTEPEIKRCNLSNVVLQLKALGIDDILGFDFIDKPSRVAIVKSLEQLYALGALTDEGKLSAAGHHMARLPLDPMYAKALIQASTFNCLEEMLIAVAMLSVESIFYFPREKIDEARAATKCFLSSEGDHVTLVNVFRAAVDSLQKTSALVLTDERSRSRERKLNKWCKDNFINSRSLRHALDVHRQICRHVKDIGMKISSCGDDMLPFRRCLAASFFLNAAMRQADGSYRALASSLSVKIHPSSALFGMKPECIIFNELVQTQQKYVRNTTRIDPLWLPELAPKFFGCEQG